MIHLGQLPRLVCPCDASCFVCDSWAWIPAYLSPHRRNNRSPHYDYSYRFGSSLEMSHYCLHRVAKFHLRLPAHLVRTSWYSFLTTYHLSPSFALNHNGSSRLSYASTHRCCQWSALAWVDGPASTVSSALSKSCLSLRVTTPWAPTAPV